MTAIITTAHVSTIKAVLHASAIPALQGMEKYASILMNVRKILTTVLLIQFVKIQLEVLNANATQVLVIKVRYVKMWMSATIVTAITVIIMQTV